MIYNHEIYGKLKYIREMADGFILFETLEKKVMAKGSRIQIHADALANRR